MTARATALHLVRWATTDMRQAMPEGDLAQAANLAEPDPETQRWIGRLAAVTAARLRLDPVPLNDRRPAGLGVAVLAAAVGAHRLGERATLLLRAVRPASRTADLLAHHGIVEPASAVLPDLAEQLRDLSPLTGVLDRPGPRSTGACESLLDRLRTDPGTRAMLVLRFAAAPQTGAQARWRGECLTYVRHEDPEFVLDVYETALLHHAREHEIQARLAWRQILVDRAPELAAPTAYWWRALAELEAAEPARIRRRPRLEHRRVGTNLFRRVQQLEAA
ncbi:hypothetical protein Daura_39850 [Dactylosporangium aurantiacum]|uniref:FtsH ternary system domain-containing protein n=1 Tax=Dactylosporangium aurantiacum TaxID=35754 RepID=A0A9Q9IBI6_9ACTN|nr:hypothetical protein [Dactylosporangium aurantiacum]MDG6101420.1 hypothetical protein [Dactylosporangium aurantiacum]UWZ52726.1 hypothetical protein Daura_39850 [Dactylosporangium aurantiacum]